MHNNNNNNNNNLNDLTSAATSTANKVKNEVAATASKAKDDASHAMHNMSSSTNSNANNKGQNEASSPASKFKNDAKNVKDKVTANARQTQRKHLHSDVDPAETIYDTAKGVWAYGKRIAVVRTLIDIAEGIAGKILRIAGTSLGSVDKCITSNLVVVDDKVLNPTLRVFADVMHTIFSPFRAIKKDIDGGEDPYQAVKREGAHLMKEGEKNVEYLKNEGQKYNEYRKKEAEKVAPEYTTKRGGDKVF